MKRIILPAVACLIFAPSAAAQRASAKGPLSFEVAGVRLNMSLVAVKQALTGTYACVEEGRKLTFEEELANEVKRRRGQRGLQWMGTGPARLVCKGPNGEALNLDFAQEKNGPVVDGLTLHIPTRIVAEADALRQLAAKFGKPTIGTMRVGAWCDPGYRCDTAVLVSEGPAFTVRADGVAVVVAAARGDRSDRERAAALTAEADRIAPKKRGAAL